MKQAFFKNSSLFIDPLLCLEICALTQAHVNTFTNQFRLAKLHGQIGFICPILLFKGKHYFLQLLFFC